MRAVFVACIVLSLALPEVHGMEYLERFKQYVGRKANDFLGEPDVRNAGSPDIAPIRLNPDPVSLDFCHGKILPSDCRAASRLAGLLTALDRQVLSGKKKLDKSVIQNAAAAFREAIIRNIYNHPRTHEVVDEIIEFATYITVLTADDHVTCRILDFIDFTLVHNIPLGSTDAVPMRHIFEKIGDRMSAFLEPENDIVPRVTQGVGAFEKKIHPCGGRKNPFYSKSVGRAAMTEVRSRLARPDTRCPAGTSHSALCTTRFKTLPCISSNRDEESGMYMCHPSTDIDDFSGVDPSPLMCLVGSPSPDVCDGAQCAVSVSCVPATVDFVCDIKYYAWTTNKLGVVRQRPLTKKLSHLNSKLWVCLDPVAVRGKEMAVAKAACEAASECPLHPTDNKYGLALADSDRERPLLDGDSESDDDENDASSDKVGYVPPTLPISSSPKHSPKNSPKHLPELKKRKRVSFLQPML